MLTTHDTQACDTYLSLVELRNVSFKWPPPSVERFMALQHCWACDLWNLNPREEWGRCGVRWNLPHMMMPIPCAMNFMSSVHYV
jgi:hypothetical protein